MHKKIVIFYHLAQIGHWKDLYLEQFQLLKSSGLYDACDFIHIGINGDQTLPVSFDKTNIKYNSDQVLEANTLEDMYHFSKENQDYKVLYFHSKGVTHPDGSQFRYNVDAWRKYLEYFNIEQWQDSVNLLDQYDCVGTELLDTAFHNDLVIPGLLYAGNFWWANSQYIATLDPSFLYDNTNGLARWQSEKWVGTGNPNAYSQYNFKCYTPYYFDYPAEQYKKKEQMNNKPKIVMNTMFRNEATVIIRMLESCYKYIDYYVIQNNGSTDGTDEIVREFFADKNIPGVLYNVEEGWQGFGWNRDHLMQYTQNVDHGCDWILKMDCDEVLEIDDDFDWTPLYDLSNHSFHITAIMGNSIYYRAWMWNAHMPWRFNHDPCHETSYCPIDGIGENFQRYDLPNKIRQIGFPEGQSWSNPTKFISDALILEEKMIKENSILTDLYHFWYIGKSYHDARHGSFPLGSSQQLEFSRRCIYYFTEYLNTTHDFSNTKTAKGIHEMAYMALIFLSSDQKFIGDIDAAIENLILSEQFAPERNDHLVALAEIYNQQQQYDKMLEITTRLVDPNRKNPFPTYHLMINSNAYVDTGNYVQSLHDIAKSNLPKEINPFMINTQLNKKLFVVDTFYSNPDQIRQFALSVEFKEDIKWYKGKRSTQYYHPPNIVEVFENIIGQKITKFDQSMPNGCFQITTANDPQVYHHDLQKWAAMIYLTPNAPIESGTRLMRSKINQATHMNDPNISDAFSGGFLDATKFEVVADAGNLYNRLVIMDAQNIHSAGTYFGQNNDTGRLTHLFFFD